MYSTLPESTSASLRSMIGIEARRFVRHPLFIIGVLAAYGLGAWGFTSDTAQEGGVVYVEGLLSHPIIPAFFIGLPSLVVAARLTRSTEVAVEAVGTAPGSEARRTLAVAGACLVPFVAGIGSLVELFLLVTFYRQPHPHELWFPTVNDLYVWGILVALGPVACLGAALLGVLVGRWLRFRGAPAVAVVLLVAVTMVGQLPYAYDPDLSKFRVWVPWAMFHTGGATSEGFEMFPPYTQGLISGNPATYVLYLLALCALAVGGAVWHDRSARTPRLTLLNWGLVATAVALYLVTALTGIGEFVVSDPMPAGQLLGE